MENFGGMPWRFLSPCVYTEHIFSFKQRAFCSFWISILFCNNFTLAQNFYVVRIFCTFFIRVPQTATSGPHLLAHISILFCLLGSVKQTVWLLEHSYLTVVQWSEAGNYQWPMPSSNLQPPLGLSYTPCQGSYSLKGRFCFLGLSYKLESSGELWLLSRTCPGFTSGQPCH